MIKNTIQKVVAALFWLSCLVSCIEEKPLKIYGERDVVNGDTVYHTIQSFRFVNQDSAMITRETIDGKIYVADFFFTSCRTICPVMKTQMLRIYEEFKDDPQVIILSHTIDPEYDTVGLLKDFAERLGVSANSWHFLTGNKDSIYTIAEKSYFATAMEDKTEPDGFIHSGAFILVDGKQRIRGMYDGTKEADVDRLIKDIGRLKREKT